MCLSPDPQESTHASYYKPVKESTTEQVRKPQEITYCCDIDKQVWYQV